MKAQERKVKDLADELGISADELLDEMEVANPVKGFTVAVRFARLADMKEFAKALSHIGVGVYYADSLDSEYGGKANKNQFVLRTVGGSKPEEWRVC